MLQNVSPEHEESCYHPGILSPVSSPSFKSHRRPNIRTISPVCAFNTMAVSNKATSWETTAKISRDVLEQSIPKQWMLGTEKLPAANLLNVTNVVEQSGILSVEEIEMTRQNVESLLSSYKCGRWTVEAVTVAFLKRATISHQLVRYWFPKQNNSGVPRLTNFSRPILRLNSSPIQHSKQQEPMTNTSGRLETWLGHSTGSPFQSRYLNLCVHFR